jgi:hypothetical protein
MISAVAHWHDIRNSDIECPIVFSDEEMEQLESGMELVEGLSLVLRQLQKEGLIPLGGMVPREQYENARRWSKYFKDEFLILAEDEEQRKMYSKLWPYS